jgi:amidase
MPRTSATRRARAAAQTDYTTFLKADALKGARIGVARDFFGADEEVDWVMESALDAMRTGGRHDGGRALSEVAARRQRPSSTRPCAGPSSLPRSPTYLATLGAELPEDAGRDDRARDGSSPRPSRRRRAQPAALGALQSRGGQRHAGGRAVLAVRDHVLPAVRVVVDGLLAEHRLDAIVYPTASRRPGLLAGVRPTRARRRPPTSPT